MYQVGQLPVTVRCSARATMLPRRARVCCLLVLLALSVLTRVEDATPFTILPDGDLVIDTTFTTKGVSTCIGIATLPVGQFVTASPSGTYETGSRA
jgi:hypothetical protein